jgi:hypothetical protein
MEDQLLVIRNGLNPLFKTYRYRPEADIVSRPAGDRGPWLD